MGLKIEGGRVEGSIPEEEDEFRRSRRVVVVEDEEGVESVGGLAIYSNRSLGIFVLIIQT